MNHSVCGWRSGSTRVEQRVGGDAAQDEVELPGEVRRVAQARAQALPQERRGQVGGVADEERAAVAQVVGEHRAELVDGVPREAAVARA